MAEKNGRKPSLTPNGAQPSGKTYLRCSPDQGPTPQTRRNSDNPAAAATIAPKARGGPEQTRFPGDVQMAGRHAERRSVTAGREVQMQTALRHPLAPLRGLLSRRQAVTRAGERVDSQAPSPTGVQTGTTAVEGRVEAPQNVGNGAATGPGDPPAGDLPEKSTNFVHEDARTQAVTAALLTVAKTWERPTCPATDGCTQQLCCVYVAECHPPQQGTKSCIS